MDSSLYYIDWKDIQLSLAEAGNAYFANASRAKSQGIEFSAEAKPSTGLTIAGWIVFNDAKLTQSFPPSAAAYGVSGDRLPFSSRISGNLSFDWDFSLAPGVMGFTGGEVSYVGDRESSFLPTAPPPDRQNLPGYAQMDLRAGVKYESWTIGLFANNVANKRGLLGGGVGGFSPTVFTLIQPRTIGLSLSKKF